MAHLLSNNVGDWRVQGVLPLILASGNPLLRVAFLSVRANRYRYTKTSNCLGAAKNIPKVHKVCFRRFVHTPYFRSKGYKTPSLVAPVKIIIKGLASLVFIIVFMPEYASLIIPCCINDAYIVVTSNACENVSRLLSKVCWEHVYKGAPSFLIHSPPT